MKVKGAFIFLLAACPILCTGQGVAAAQEGISLPDPRVNGGKPLMEALSQRRSLRSFDSRSLPDEVLSNLLWAAFGINRPDTGRRTAPSASNRQEIDIYVATAGGVFVYDAKNNRLDTVTGEDIREFTGRQNFVRRAPVVLVYVADYRRMKGEDRQKEFYSAADTGFISQNVYLFCASEGLATVVIGLVDKGELAKKLGLSKEQKVILSQPVGYPAQ